MPHSQDNSLSNLAASQSGIFGGPTSDQEKAPSQPIAPLTFGQQLVSLQFNPSGDDKVGQAKQLFAQITDLLEAELASRELSRMGAILHDHTIGEILNAQMNVVKMLTLKY